VDIPERQMQMIEDLEAEALSFLGDRKEMICRKKASIKDGWVDLIPWHGELDVPLSDTAAITILAICRELRSNPHLEPWDLFTAAMELNRWRGAMRFPKLAARLESKRARKRASIKHERTRKAKASIIEAWTTGKYKSKNACAKSLHEKYFISEGVARKYLQGIPEPVKKM